MPEPEAQDNARVPEKNAKGYTICEATEEDRNVKSRRPEETEDSGYFPLYI